MIFKQLIAGPIVTNTYIIGSEQTKEIALIDPGFEPERIIAELDKIKPESLKVLLTHGHLDHSIYLDKIKQYFTNLTLMYHKDEYNPNQKKITKENLNELISLMIRYNQPNTHVEYKNNEKDFELVEKYGLFTKIKADEWLQEGSKIRVGEITLKTLETPGHSSGSLSFYSDDIKEVKGHLIDGIIFTGDLLFQRTVGAFDIPGGDKQLLFSSIKNKIMYNPALTNHFKIFGGHLGATTIAEERHMNSFREYFL